MKKLLGLLLTICFTVLGFSGTCEARLADNDRRAVVLEAFYALRQSHDGGCDRTLNGNCISTWNYLNNDYGSYLTLKNWYSCFSSDWAIPGDPCSNLTGLTVPSFYSNLASYGYSSIGTPYPPFGRGGQCTFFTNLILYRSGTHQMSFPSLATMWSNTESDLQKVVEGDVLQRFNDPSGTNHVAIVVQVYRSGTTVTGIDVIDSNWLSESGVKDHEIIGRHLFSLSGQSSIQGHFRIWKGTAYYAEPYVP